jgi:hypothetical protein
MRQRIVTDCRHEKKTKQGRQRTAPGSGVENVFVSRAHPEFFGGPIARLLTSLVGGQELLVQPAGGLPPALCDNVSFISNRGIR